MLGIFIGALAMLVTHSPADVHTTLRAALPSAKSLPARAAPPRKNRTESFGIQTSARCAFVADVASGHVLFAKNPHQILPIASLTKLVTAMVFLDQKPDLSKSVIMTEEDFDPSSARVFHVGETLTYADLLTSMLVGSVNTSANVLARSTLGRAKFVEAMNAKTRALRLVSPHFVDPSGLDVQNRANAADVAAIISAAIAYPSIRDVSIQSNIVVRGKIKEYHISSTNLLLSSYVNQKPFRIVAAKTGSLPTVGFNMAQVTKNANGKQIVAVELGSQNTFSRFQDIKALTTWAFDTHTWN